MKTKKLLYILLTTSLTMTPIVSHASDYSQSKPNAKPITTQIGGTFEERNAYLNGYLFINQMINKRFYWELRGYYIYTLISQPVPTRLIPLPAAKDEKHLQGTGGVIILGYNIPLNCKVALLPFFRFQYLTNTSFVYDDDFGNKITSKSYTYYLGAKLSMEVTQLFAVYINYYAGYQRNILHGKKYFITDSTPLVRSITSTYEIGFPYKVADAWTLTPYIQLVISTNKANHAAWDYPIHHPGLTTSTTVFALKLGYSF